MSRVVFSRRDGDLVIHQLVERMAWTEGRLDLTYQSFDQM
jgi:hypothetical protein